MLPLALTGRATSQVSVSEIQTASLDPRRPARQLARRRRHANDSGSWCKPGYALRRRSDARTRLRNCAGVAGVSVGGVGEGFGVTTVGAAAFAAFFAALRSASC